MSHSQQLNITKKFRKNNFGQAAIFENEDLKATKHQSLRNLLPTLLIIILSPLLLAACSRFDSHDKAALEWKEVTFERLQGNLSRPLSERIQEIPPVLLKAIKDADQSLGMANAPRYAARTPTAKDATLVSSYIHLLPKPYQAVFSKKLLGMYFIDNFSGAGMTDWIVDKNNNKYYYMVLNSALLKASMDDWLTYRGDSYFDKPGKAPRIRVRTNTDFKAIMYALLHEGAHVIDYELGVTPYSNPLEKKLRGHAGKTFGFTDGVWLQRTHPVAGYDFKHRGKLNPYGAIAKKGLISRSELSLMFSQLTKSPFVSFYGGTSWNEDFADSMAYQILEQKLGGTVKVDLLNKRNKVIGEYEPVKVHRGDNREGIIHAIYEIDGNQ